MGQIHGPTIKEEGVTVTVADLIDMLNDEDDEDEDQPELRMPPGLLFGTVGSSRGEPP